ncbi:sensor histidine kinase [Endothiovibrio diazotrophicus]
MPQSQPHPRFATPLALLEAVAVVVIATILAALLEEVLHHANLSLLYLTAALVIAIRRGLWPSLFASLLGFLAYNFLYTEPRFSLVVGAREDLYTLLFFILMTALTGHLAASMRAAHATREQALTRLNRVSAELEEERLVSETERLRAALLSSVSHDLRTPLASIIGSTTSLLEYGGNFSADDRRALLAAVLDEAERLNRYIQNLLDMTKLGNGAVTPRRDWVDPRDLIAVAVERIGAALEPFEVREEVAADLPLLYLQGSLIEQALVNLLYNAAGFSPPGAPIIVRGYLRDGKAILEVVDRGPGIPEAERRKVFDMFYRADQGDRTRQGAGLGLAICHGMVAAHGGSVEALPGDDGVGTCVRLTLPVEEHEDNETDE